MRKLIKGAVISAILFTTQSQAMENESVNADTLGSETTECTLNELELNPVDDPIYFTIKNETHADVPVNLRITYFQPHFRELCREFKLIKADTESYFRQSECIRFKEEIDAYIAPEPEDYNFHVTMSFNMENVKFKRKNIDPDGLSGGESWVINPSYVPYGCTYIIKPNDFVTSSEVMVKSFKITLID